jgi:hypothetical protein
MFLTAELLRERGACSGEVDKFREMYPNGVLVTPEECVARANDWSWGWAMDELLKRDEREVARERYRELDRANGEEVRRLNEAHRARLRELREPYAAALDARDELLRNGDAAYDRICQGGAEAFDQITSGAREERNRRITEAERVYQEAIAQARAEYDTARTIARQALDTVRKVATAERENAVKVADERHGEAFRAYQAAVDETRVGYVQNVAPLRGEALWAKAFGEVAGQVTDRWQPPEAVAPVTTDGDGGKGVEAPADAVRAAAGE